MTIPPTSPATSHGDGSHGEGERHDVNRHDARIRAFCMRHEAPLAPAALDLFLELLRKAHGPRLLRVKGIVALGDDPSRPVVVQGVQHVFHPPLRLRPGLTPITAPAWLLFCATWNRLSSKLWADADWPRRARRQSHGASERRFLA